MGPGTGLIVGIPFVVLAIALFVLLRRERLNREKGLQVPRHRLILFRLLTVTLVVFVALLVAGVILGAVSSPSTN
jgi:hypothetical protein